MKGDRDPNGIVECIELVQGRAQWQTFVVAEMDHLISEQLN